MNDGNSSLLYDAKYVSRAWIYNGDGCVQFWKIIAKSHNHLLLACIQLSILGSVARVIRAIISQNQKYISIALKQLLDICALRPNYYGLISTKIPLAYSYLRGIR